VLPAVKAAATDAVFSPVLPDGTVVTEVQIQARPLEDTWICEALMYLHIVGSTGLTNSQIIESPSLVKWLGGQKPWLWESKAKFVNERWPCHIVIHGSNQRLAWFPQALDDFGVQMRVSVQYEPI